ncbi:MAG: hypothetical protein MJ143_06605, partial [Clostridia bacterium]|nr:hypothetical protein [Clostridia bacterium]
WAIKNGNSAEALKVLDQVIYAGRELTQFATDFAQYLRNLYVAKATGGITELINIPSDYEADFLNQVNALSEEALTRYIRIISNLINDIRYAPQKRVLTEVALIKLCRPESEANVESVAERIERIEERIDSGQISVNMNMATAPIVDAGNNSFEQPKPEPVLEVALPEDVERAAANWGRILPAIHPLNREFVQNAKVSVTEDGQRLLLLFTDVMSYKQMSNEKAVNEVQEAIASVIERRVELEIKHVEKKEAAEFVDLEKMFKNKVVFEETE